MPGAADEAFHVIDENNFLRPELDLFKNEAVDPGVGFAGAHLMGRKNFFEMTEQFKVLFYVAKMKRVGIRD